MTSLELTRKYISRIKELNPRWNIVIRENFEGACERAARLDLERGQKGPLHGVPYTIKDAFRVAKTPTSYGFPGMRLLPAFDNCALVQRLEHAGAVLLGQTNVPLSCF